MIEAQFREPPATYRPVAMWFMNGRLELGEVRRQIGAMAAGGIGGIQVAARTGLEIPYLSERWFEVVELILDEAPRYGIGVWLADEYPYPSGVSGGEVVLRHPEYRGWQMRAQRVLAAPGEEVRAVAPGSVPLRACAVPVIGGVAQWKHALTLDAYVGLLQHQQVLFQPTNVYLTTRRYMTNGPRPTLCWRAADGPQRWEIWLIAAAEITDYKFFGSYVDLCNRDACQLFLATTYERYLARLGPERFVQLAGFFLDEAHPQNWSWQLPEFFRQQRGYDLVEVLPALWTDIGPRTARVRYDYRQSITELFVESFMKPVAEFCRDHSLKLSLEVPSTRNVVQRHADIPGIDPGHDKVGVPLDDILARELPSYRGNLNFPASLAAQTGRRRVLDELFHSVGWSLTLQDMKAMLDRAAARGANLFAFHAFCYSIGGLRKWDAPPSEFDQNPYWPYFPLLSAYAGRLAYALSRGRRIASVAVVDPITSIWAHSTEPGLEPDTVAQRITADWTKLMRELTAAQRPHDNLDPVLLAEATVAGGTLRLAEAEYRAVVLPSMTTLERSAWEKLEEFVAAGGQVVACGLLPHEEIESESRVVSRCRAAFGGGAQDGFVLVQSAAEVLELLDKWLPTDLRLTPVGGELARRQFLLAQRRDGDTDIFFLANSSMDVQACELKLRGAQSRVTRLDLETGQAEQLETWRGARVDEQQVRLEFPRHGAHLLLVEPLAQGDGGTTPTPSDPPLVDLDLDGDWHCELGGDDMNCLRFDRFRFTTTDTDDGDGLQRASEALARADAPVIEPKPMINVFQDLMHAGRAWPGELAVTPIFGAPPRLDLKLPTNAWYETTFDARYVPARAVLCIEDAALAGDWELWINGHSVARSAFVQRRRWSVDNREADITLLLEFGPNTLRARVRVTESWDGLLDALYLLGDFGVLHDGSAVLTEAPTQLRWRDRHVAGYPYFSGTLRLSTSVSLPVSGGPIRVRLPDQELMFAGVAELAIDGRTLGVRAWAPYVWVVPPGMVASRVSQVTLSITNTLIEQLEGKRYDALRGHVVPVLDQRL